MPFKTPNKTSDFIRKLITTPKHLREIEDYADKNFIPILLPESAVFLHQIITLKSPQKILEIGTGIGYSGSILLSQSSTSQLFTIEHNENSIETAKIFFTKFNLLHRVTFFSGDESDIVPIIDGKFDLIFLDGAKTRYVGHLPYIKKLLNAGGILIADNVLFNGMVSGENKTVGKKASIVESMRAFLADLTSDSDFDTSVLPVGDGIAFSIRKAE